MAYKSFFYRCHNNLYYLIRRIRNGKLVEKTWIYGISKDVLLDYSLSQRMNSRATNLNCAFGIVIC